MIQYIKDFSLDPKHVWLNVASEGPLPNKANAALQEAVIWKSSPHLLTHAKFHQVPLDLKRIIARLLRVDHNEVVLGNSATYGLHLLSHGISFKAKDEIILLENDFPTDILPWLSLEKKGVIVRQVKAREHVLTPPELQKAISPRTRLVCLPLVHSFTGYRIDIKAIGEICRKNNVLLVLNISQAAGAFEIDLAKWKVDAAVCAGYKWLLGPYGTGFCWIKKGLLEDLNYDQNYWISLMNESMLEKAGPITLKDDHSARRYDVFGTANFFNYVPWQASIEYLLSLGMAVVEKYDQSLVDQFLDGLDHKKYDLISPFAKKDRTNIMVFSCKDPAKNADLYGALNNKGFHLALWKNNLRVSPHIYNSKQEIEDLLESLNSFYA